jgi:hypothetical protein
MADKRSGESTPARGVRRRQDLAEPERQQGSQVCCGLGAHPAEERGGGGKRSGGIRSGPHPQ